jgi:hypothetical protein
LVFRDESLYTSKFRWAETEVPGECNRFQPEFRGLIVTVHVNMRRFIRFVAVKIHSVRPCHQDGRHISIISSGI